MESFQRIQDICRRPPAGFLSQAVQCFSQHQRTVMRHCDSANLRTHWHIPFSRESAVVQEMALHASI